MYYTLRTFLGTQEKGTNRTQKSRETGSSREAQPGGAGRAAVLEPPLGGTQGCHFDELPEAEKPTSSHSQDFSRLWPQEEKSNMLNHAQNLLRNQSPPGGEKAVPPPSGCGGATLPLQPLSSHLTKRRRSTFPSSESTRWGALEAAWAESTWGPDAGQLRDAMRLEADRCLPSSNPAAHQQGSWELTQTFSLWGVFGNAWARGAGKDKGTRVSKHRTFRPPDQMNENLTSSPRCLLLHNTTCLASAPNVQGMTEASHEPSPEPDSDTEQMLELWHQEFTGTMINALRALIGR